jgi:hypothetical protein
MEQRRSQSIVQEKSFAFAVQLVTYGRRLRNDSTDLVLTRLGKTVDSGLSTQHSALPGS